MSGLVEDKARALLVSGSVTVTEVRWDSVRARVQGHHGEYEVLWAPSVGWRCSCPDRQKRCSHVAAVKRVTLADQAVRP